MNPGLNEEVFWLKQMILDSDLKHLIQLMGMGEDEFENIGILLFGLGNNEFSSQNLPICNENSIFTIDSVNGKDNFFWLDSVVAKQLLYTGTSTFGYNQCINLDTQVVSYLMRLMRTKDKNKNKFYSETYKILEYLIENNLDFSAYPYMIENAGKVQQRKIPIFETMGIFEYVKGMNLEDFQNYFSKDNEIVLEIDLPKTDNTLRTMERISDETEKFDLQFLIKCLLIKTGLLSFEKNKDTRKKISDLIEFTHKKLGIFMERELALCIKFLKDPKDKQIAKFFKRIQKSNKDIVKFIDSMAWDLFHVRELANSIYKNYLQNPDQVFDMHSLLTFDQGLGDVLKAYPVKAIIFQGRKPFWIFEESLDQITDVDVFFYFTEDKIIERKMNYENVVFSDLAAKLEDEIETVVNN